LGLARVLKQHRGNGGQGVFKVQLVQPAASGAESRTALVRVQHAAPRDGTTEEVSLGVFLDRMAPYFSGPGHLIDQPFATRVSEGMVRAYLVKDHVVGFARQYADHGDPGHEAVPPERVFGIPAPKTMLEASDPALSTLRRNLEDSWVDGLMALTGTAGSELPLLWDADFLFGTKDVSGNDTYALCEVNVSCVSPFPTTAPSRLAQALAQELEAR